VPFVRLSAFYFVYFAAIGALVPYFNPYLQHLGYSPAQIGQATALLLAGRIVAPGIWGWIADQGGRRLRIVRSTCLLAGIAFAFVFVARDFPTMGFVLVMYGLFHSASLPQFEAITLNHLGDRLHDYTRIRLWGSVGFIVTAGILGALLQRVGIAWLPAILLTLIGCVWLTSMAMPEERPVVHPHGARAPILEVLRRPGVMALFASFLLMQLSYGPYYAFYTIFLEERGYSRTLAGLLWALGVVAEVALFMVMHRLLPAWGLRKLMLVSILAAVIRWLLIGFGVQWLIVLIVAQLLHAATFGMHHAAAVQYMHIYFVGRHQGRGQALYSSMAYGVGGAASAFATGHLWTALGPAGTFTVAAVLCAVNLVVAWQWLDDDARIATQR
jgi:PPP family 3-phenylpropionic acid transporter